MGVFVTAGTAAAGTSGHVYTTDGQIIGGKGIFNDYGEKYRACDLQADGYRVRVELSWGNNVRSVEDADGANNNCHYGPDVNIAEGTKVWLQVCLKDGANGVKKWCASDSFIA